MIFIGETLISPTTLSRRGEGIVIGVGIFELVPVSIASIDGEESRRMGMLESVVHQFVSSSSGSSYCDGPSRGDCIGLEGV